MFVLIFVFYDGEISDENKWVKENSEIYEGKLKLMGWVNVDLRTKNGNGALNKVSK